MHEVASQLISHGVLGPVVIALGYAYWRKDKQLQECHNCRVQEAVDATKTIVDGTQAMRESTEAVRENTKTIRELATRRRNHE